MYIDVRGSGGRGWKYRSPIYRGLVTVEVEDTLEAIKYQLQTFTFMLNISLRMVLAKYPRFDKNRLGVFGWSYGGTMAIRLVQVSGKKYDTVYDSIHLTILASVRIVLQVCISSCACL